MTWLPTELQWHIFSFLPYHELYNLRKVCNEWKTMIEEHIYFDIKKQQHTVNITLGQYPYVSTMKLLATSYDNENKILEFKPKEDEDGVIQLELPTLTSWQFYHHRQLQIKFSPWQPLQIPNAWLQVLTPQEKSQANFHMKFNPNLECTYNYPAFDYFNKKKLHQQHQEKEEEQHEDQHYVGDKSLILSFSYIPQEINQSNHSSTNNDNNNINNNNNQDAYYYYNNTPIASRNLSLPLPPKIKIHWLRVTMDWIVSGFQPSIQPTQIYNDRYTCLYKTLVQSYGCVKYDEYSEPVIDYILHHNNKEKEKEKEKDNSKIPKQLLSYIQEHSHECQTRLKRLQHMLEGAGLDHRMVWKYNFAKTYIVENSLLSEEDIVHRILDTEEEWRTLYQSLLKRLKSLSLSSS